MSRCFFTTEDGHWFQPTQYTRGPWHPEHCHAGPPTGLLARAAERALLTELESTGGSGHRLTRLTVNLNRPIPFSGFSVEATVVRSGRSVSYTQAQILDTENRICAKAEGLHIQQRSQSSFPSYQSSFGCPADADPGKFPILPKAHPLPAFTDGVDTRYPDGEDSSPGPTTLWLKTVPLLPSETASAFQRICPLADCGNAIGRNAEVDEVTFINADLTIVLHRDPVGEWLGSQSVGYWEPDGIGMADALLFDEQGAVGRALQCVLLNRL
ncbi:MAG: thioesterase family protein [Gammaproteobacteria bacterium]|nr:thioesterase family protein [Gammaproteobacteria bacterium]